MTKDEALKLALEALEECHQLIYGDETKGGVSDYMDGYYGSCFDFVSNKNQINEAITAIKEALAQPEQEPVGEVVDAIEGAFKCSFTKMLPVGTKLYTTPPQRKPLTEQKIGAILEDTNAFGTRLYTFARAIEAAHGIKGEA